MGLEEAEKMKGEDPCWDNYEMIGTKPGKGGRPVPNCVLKKPKKAKPKNEEVEIAEAKVGDTVSFHHELKSAPGSKVKKSGTVEKVDGDVVHVKVKDKYGVKRHQIKMGDLVKEDTELEEASRSLPSHLQKLIKDKNLDKKPMTMVTPSQKEKLKSTVKDVTPKGYGPNEEVEMDEGMLDAVKGAVKSVAKRVADSAKSTAVGFVHGAIDSATSHSPILRHAGNKLHRVVKKKLGEETEQIDELNKDTVYSYNKKADADVEKKHKSLGQLMRRGDAAGANKAAHQINRRLAGMERAEKRLNSEETELGEEIKKAKMTPQERAYKRKLELKAVVQEAVKKMKDTKGDPSQSKNVKKGELLSGKQEPVKLNPELQEK